MNIIHLEYKGKIYCVLDKWLLVLALQLRPWQNGRHYKPPQLIIGELPKRLQK